MTNFLRKNSAFFTKGAVSKMILSEEKRKLHLNVNEIIVKQMQKGQESLLYEVFGISLEKQHLFHKRYCS